MKTTKNKIYNVWQVFFLIFVISLLFVSTNYAQYINKGMWYHQQPTDAADSDLFYGGSSTYEGWCGPSALGMIFHYYVPNIHKILYDKYGPVDYHSTDSRGGLTSADPYCYDPNTTYPFGDFLGHNYLGYHVTTDGVGFSGLKTIIAGVDADVDSYTADYGYVPLSEIRNYLENGYLIVMNTTEGHYITIAGWEGSLTDPDQRYYYVWDGWNYPLGMESYTYKTDLVGNKPNYGTAQNISVYTITATTINAHFRDQLGDRSVLAVKFTPVNLPQSVSEVGAKGVWVWGSSVRNEGESNFVNNVASHGITDIFLLVKGTGGSFYTQTLEDIIPLAHQNGIKVHAWVIVLNDMEATASGNYTGVGGDWIDARDENYRSYIINDIITPLCALDIDGIHLDCIRYPGNANNYSGSQAAITEYCRLTRETMDNNGKASASLSAAIMPEGDATAVIYGQDVSIMTQYMAFITPMTYTHNYKTSPSWVGNQTAYFVNNVVTGCEVWAGIQSSDDDGNYMTPLELRQSVDFASANGSAGIVYFRYPLTSWQWELSDEWTVTGGVPVTRGAITDATTNNAEYYRGDTVVVEIIVKNTGDLDIENAVAEWDIKNPTGTIVASYSKSMVLLIPGSSDTLSDTYVLDATSEFGTWSVDYVYKMSDGTVLDSSALNNHLPISFSVVELPASGLQHKSVWAWGSTVRDVGISAFVDEMAAHGITDFFLLVKGVNGTFNTQTLSDIIPVAHAAGVKVHAWIIVLQDDANVAYYTGVGGSWIDARDTGYRDYIINTIVDQICDYDIDGIHLDCIRYPGNADNYSGSQEAITEYCRQTREKMDSKGRTSAVLSAAIMPEGDATAVIYGQDVSTMTQYMAFITPMTYTHSYGTSPSWVGDQTAYFVSHVVSGCEVWTGVQTSDDEGVYMESWEMDACIQNGVDNGARGVAYFRYPLTSWQWDVSDSWVVSSSEPEPVTAGSITSAETNSSEYVSGDTVVVKIVVENTGDVDLENTLVNWNIKDPNGSVMANYSKSVAILSVGAVDSVSDIYILAAGSEIGTWNVEYAFKASDGSVLDSSALNGNTPASFNVISDEITDAVISSISTENLNYYPADKVKAFATVVNNGSDIITSASVKFVYRDPDSVAVQTATVSVPDLSVGDSVTVCDSSLTLGSIPLDVDGIWQIEATLEASDSTVLDENSGSTFNVYRTVSKAQFIDMADRLADWIDANYYNGYHTYPNYVNVGDGRTVSLAQMYDILGTVLQQYFVNQKYPDYVVIRACAGQPSAGDANSWMWKDIGRSDDDRVSFYSVADLWADDPEYKHYVELDDFLDACDRSATFVDSNYRVPNYVTVWNDYYSAYWNSVPACQFLYMMSRTIRYNESNGAMPSIVSIRDMYVPRSTDEWEQYADVESTSLSKTSSAQGNKDFDEKIEIKIPDSFELSQNYPNPFNPSTTISFAIPKSANVELSVYNVLGEKVAELVNGSLSAGYHSVTFDASYLTSGIYIYRISAGNNVSVKKMMLMK